MKRQLRAVVRDLTAAPGVPYTRSVLEVIEGLFALGIVASFIYVLVGAVHFVIGTVRILNGRDPRDP